MAIAKQYERYLWNRILQTVLVLVLVGVGFLIVGRLFVRWDLTEDQRFTISDASRRMARELRDPLTIRAYFTEKLPEQYAPIAQQVYDILAEYKAAGGGRITVERYDPEASQKDRGDAENYGIKPHQLPVFKASERSLVLAYGGIVMLYRDRASEVLDIAFRYGQGYEGLAALEYEISSRISRLSSDRTTVGLAGYLSREPQQDPFNPQRGGPQPEFEGLRKILGEGFDVESVNLKEKDLDPAKVPLLLLVRPREMSEVEVFRLDQYLVSGGRVMIFASQGTIEVAPWGDGSWMWKPFKTGLDEWLRFQGLSMPNEFVMHGYSARKLDVEREVLPGLRGAVRVPNYFWPLIVAEQSFDRENPAIQTLKQILLYWAHPVDVMEDKLGTDKKATVLVRSHEEESWRWKDTSRVDFRRLTRDDGPSSFVSSPVVVAVEGKFKSYYADRSLPPSLGGETKDPAPEDGEEEAPTPPEPPKDPAPAKDAPKAPEVVKESLKPTQLVVLGNSIFISDAVGLQEGGEAAKQATLLAFNLVDWLAGSPDLIALRAKRYADRAISDRADLDKQVMAIQERLDKDEIDIKQALAERDRAQEAQAARRNGWRWRNILGPCLFVLLAGATVWVLRAAMRARPASIPAAVAPTSRTD